MLGIGTQSSPAEPSGVTNPMNLSPAVVLSFVLALFSHCPDSSAQEKSVNPGINDSFRNPKPQEFVERFEIESREVFQHRQKILEACRIERGQTVADVGAGTGLFTRLLSGAVGEIGRVVAVDIAAEFLDHIRATSEKLEQKNVETLLCKADSTELPENSVDVAFICDTYHHFEFPLKTMASLHRALKPGGRVIVVDFRRIEGVSSEWTMKHVRAGQEVVEAEIRQCGFRKSREKHDLLKDNYVVEFQKIQEPAELKTSLIPGVGAVAGLTGAPEAPRGGARVVFDVTAAPKAGEVNAGLERAARLLNLYGLAGRKASDVQITVVLHGDAAAAALVNKSAGPEENINLQLIAELNRAGVDIVVCGQTLARKKIPHADISEGVLIVTSAMTSLINQQADGASLICVQ